MAGRPMNPLPPGTPKEVAELVLLMRELLRHHGNPSFAELAERSGLGKSTISHALGGQRLPNRHTMEELLKAIAGPDGLSGSERRDFLERWYRAQDRMVHGERQAQPVVPPPTADTAADGVMVEGDRIWLVQAKHRSPAGPEEAEGTRVWVFNADEHQAAAAEVAAATRALNAAMDRLEHATAEVAEARAVLREATERAGSTLRDTEAALRSADDTRTEG
ncbi:helix-turn-helix domain-containing protein (plasmid) [Streptomyces sp. NBC_00335]|uniref:helix-turn-helix domain-containing protein n=1 Tax=unclassified Streptomyces TaxID=2593676 RepID=UPI00225471EC|nr:MULTISPECIES: helix-turn-helix transcriptional regulator [unclassified Streptomyces]MCX5410141.1 helix-turn-helix domain-containing protein [Streptomyces sp. NBC_00086]